MAQQDAEVDIGAVMGALKKAAVPIAVVAAILSFLIFSYLLSKPDIYHSSGQIILDRQVNNLTVATTGQLEQLPKEILLSQLSVLSSKENAREVLTKLNLFESDVLDPLADGVGTGMSIKLWLGMIPDLRGLSKEERILYNFDQLVGASLADGSRVITVGADTENSEISADLVNGLITNYIDNINLDRENLLENTHDAIDTQIANVKKQIADLEHKSLQIRTQSGIFSIGDGRKAEDEELSRLAASLLETQNMRVERQARAKQIRKLLSEGALDTASEVISSPAVSDIRSRLITLLELRAQLLTTYLPAHPRVKEVASQIAIQRSALKSAMEKFARNYDTEAQIALEKERKITASLAALKEDILDINEDQVKLQSYSQEITAQRRFLESLISKKEEVTSRQKTQQTGDISARQIVIAESPNVPNPKFAGSASILTFIIINMLAHGIVFLISAMKNNTKQPHYAQQAMPPFNEAYINAYHQMAHNDKMKNYNNMQVQPDRMHNETKSEFTIARDLEQHSQVQAEQAYEQEHQQQHQQQSDNYNQIDEVRHKQEAVVEIEELNTLASEELALADQKISAKKQHIEDYSDDFSFEANNDQQRKEVTKSKKSNSLLEAALSKDNSIYLDDRDLQKKQANELLGNEIKHDDVFTPAIHHNDQNMRIVEPVFVDRISIEAMYHQYLKIKPQLSSRRILITGQTDFLTAIAGIEFSRACFRAGKRVCLVDATLKMNLLNQQLGLNAPLGLAEILRNTHNLQSVLAMDVSSGMSILAGGNVNGLDMRALQSAEMALLLSHLENHFDYICFCGPNLSVYDQKSHFLNMFEFILLAAQVGQDRDVLEHRVNMLKSLGKNQQNGLSSTTDFRVG